MKDRLARRRRKEEQRVIAEESAKTNAIWASMSDEQKLECVEAHEESMAALREFNRLSKDLPFGAQQMLLAVVMCDVYKDNGDLYRCKEELQVLREPLLAPVRVEKKYGIVLEYIINT